MSASKCGTYAGYQAHQYVGEPTCADCREAARLYQAAYRAKGGPAIDRERARHRAQTAALWRLKDLHRDEFDLLVADEMRVEAARAREQVAS